MLPHLHQLDIYTGPDVSGDLLERFASLRSLRIVAPSALNIIFHAQYLPPLLSHLALENMHLVFNELLVRCRRITQQCLNCKGFHTSWLKDATLRLHFVSCNQCQARRAVKG